MTEWIIEVNDGQEVLGRDDGLYDVVVSDTFNPFGNFAKGFFDDLEGATVIYNDGENAVTVDDSSDQLEIQDNLGAPGPGQEGTKISRPKITNFEDAIDVGEQALQDRESTLTGPVTTFDLNSAEPGEVIGITIDPRGIDTDFRIAENRMQWRSETNELTVIAKKGADDDILIQQSKTLKRVENRVQDLDIVPDRVTDTKATALLDVSATDGTVTEDSSSFVNDGRNRLRDGIIQESTIGSFRMEFSTSDARVIRSDSSLSNVVDTQTPSVSTNVDTVTYTASTAAAEFQSSGVAASCFQASDYSWFNAALGILGNRIGPGEVTVTIEVTEECLDGSGNPQPAYVDVFNIRDTRFNYTLDDTTDANDQLSGPENYPDLFTFDGIEPAVARRDLDFALLEQVWDDTSNQQFIEVASDSGFTDSIRVDNSQVVDGTLNETREIYTRVGLSRYTSDSTTSPTSGDTGQAVDLQELFANPDAIGRSEIGEATLRAIISGRNAVGTTFAESGLFDQNGNLLTSGVVPEFEKIQDQLVISSERLRFENE